MNFLLFALPLWASFNLTLLTERFCRARHLLDLPSERKFHKIPVPRFGGITFFLIPVIGCLSLQIMPPWPWFVGALIVYAGGIYDDLHPQNTVWAKLAFQIPAALLVTFGVPLDSLDFSIAQEAVVRFLSFGFIFFMINAANLMDNMNGLTAGLCLVTLPALAFVAMSQPAMASLVIPLVFLTLAILGFYLRNFPFGKIYMGDQGSQLLGFTVAATAVWLVPRTFTSSGWPLIAQVSETLFILNALYIADVLLVVVTRIRAGRSIFQGDQCHISHRLSRTALGPIGAVLFMIGVQVILVCWALGWHPL